MTERLPTLERQEAIAEATLRLLADMPVEEITTRQVARALGISQPALFRHFRSREQLVLAAVARARADLEQIASSVLGAPVDAVEQLRLLGESLLRYVETWPGLPRLLFASVAPGRDPIRGALRHLVSMQSALVTELVHEGQGDGLVSTAIEAGPAATLFVGALQGLVLGWEAGGRRGALAPRFAPVFALWLRAVAVDERAPARAAQPPATAATAAAVATHPTTVAAPPAAFAADPLRSLDVRPILAGGVDPLSAILDALRPLPQGGVLAVTAPFRPAPLLALLDKRGHAASAEALSDRNWLVVVVVGGAPTLDDLRDLEPPLPLEHVLSAVESLAPGAVYLARLPRFPRLLLPHLRERGLDFAIHDLPDGSALLRAARPA